MRIVFAVTNETLEGLLSAALTEGRPPAAMAEELLRRGLGLGERVVESAAHPASHGSESKKKAAVESPG